MKAGTIGVRNEDGGFFVLQQLAGHPVSTVRVTVEYERTDSVKGRLSIALPEKSLRDLVRRAFGMSEVALNHQRDARVELAAIQLERALRDVTYTPMPDRDALAVQAAREAEDALREILESRS